MERLTDLAERAAIVAIARAANGQPEQPTRQFTKASERASSNAPLRPGRHLLLWQKQSATLTSQASWMRRLMARLRGPLPVSSHYPICPARPSRSGWTATRRTRPRGRSSRPPEGFGGVAAFLRRNHVLGELRVSLLTRIECLPVSLTNMNPGNRQPISHVVFLRMPRAAAPHFFPVAANFRSRSSRCSLRRLVVASVARAL